MCLIFFALEQHADYPLIIAANRDEYYQRPTAAMQFWPDSPILAGRDLQAGGSWLGIHRNGRFAAITNYREGQPQATEPSRGVIVPDYLASSLSCEDFAAQLRPHQQRYAGFNLVFGQLSGDGGLYHLSNRSTAVSRLATGINGLSNGLLNSRWPKIDNARPLIEQLANQPFDAEDWFALLNNRQQAAAAQLPNTGIEQASELLLSSRFIVGDNYGTRSSTVLCVNRQQQLTVYERSYDAQGLAIASRFFRLPLFNR